MALDKNLIFDENAEQLTTGASTNYLDLAIGRNIGAGTPLYIESLVRTAMTDAGSDSTMTLTLETDDNTSFSSPTELQTIGTFSATSAAGTKLSVGLVISDSVQRYIRVKYTVANGDLTTGKFSTYITPMPLVSVAYADNLA
jgi:hypothetical protein